MVDVEIRGPLYVTLILNEREIHTLRKIMQNPDAYDRSTEVQELSEELFHKLSDVINKYLK